MRCLDKTESVQLARHLGITLSSPTSERFGSGLGSILSAAIPSKVSQQEVFIKGAFDVIAREQPLLIYFTAWNVFSRDAGILYLIEKARSSCGECQPLVDAPGHLFEPSEKDLAIGVARIVAAFDWDALIIPINTPKLFLEIRDEFLYFGVADALILTRVKEFLTSFTFT